MSSTVPMRDLTNPTYSVRVSDGDMIHKFFYRMPGNDELSAYQAGLFQRRGHKIVPRTAEMRLKFGKRVLLGFEEGTLGADGKLIASEKTSPNYCPAWKDILVTNRPDIVSSIGRHVFESVSVVGESGIEMGMDEALQAILTEEGEGSTEGSENP
jgi:hypothetical protein